MSGPNKPSKRWMMILDIWNSLYIWNSVAIYHVLSKPGECTALHRHDTKDARVLPSSFAFSGKELQVHVLQWIQLQLEGCNCFHSTSLEEICPQYFPIRCIHFLFALYGSPTFHAVWSVSAICPVKLVVSSSLKSYLCFMRRQLRRLLEKV